MAHKWDAEGRCEFCEVERRRAEELECPYAPWRIRPDIDERLTYPPIDDDWGWEDAQSSDAAPVG